jgi:hypothetical protein
LLYQSHHVLSARIEEVTALLFRPLSISQTFWGYEKSITCPKRDLTGACASRRRQKNVATSAGFDPWLVKRGMRPAAMKRYSEILGMIGKLFETR